MASDIEKATKHKEVDELVRLSYAHEGDSAKLQGIGTALQQVVYQLDPKKNKDELAYITKALDCPELDGARSAARAALGWPPELRRVKPRGVPAKSASGDGGVKTTRCPECGTPGEEDATVCPACGSSLTYAPYTPITWTCPACGGQARLEWDWCPQCGQGKSPHTVRDRAAEQREWEALAEEYEPQDRSLRRRLLLLRPAAAILAFGGILIWILWYEGLLWRNNWTCFLVGWACIAAGILLLRVDANARKVAALHEGAVRPEDLPSGAGSAGDHDSGDFWGSWAHGDRGDDGDGDGDDDGD